MVCVRAASQTSGWARRMLWRQWSAASPASPLLLAPLSATQQAYWWGQWRGYGMQLSSPCGCCADMGDIQSQIMQVIHSCHTERELPSCSNVYGDHEFQVRAEEDKKRTVESRKVCYSNLPGTHFERKHRINTYWNFFPRPFKILHLQKTRPLRQGTKCYQNVNTLMLTDSVTASLSAPTCLCHAILLPRSPERSSRTWCSSVLNLRLSLREKFSDPSTNQGELTHLKAARF